MSGSPRPKWSSRMSNVVRRASLLTTRRSSTSLNSEQDGDKASLTSQGGVSVDSSPVPPTLAPPAAIISAMSPSPIAESPAREAAATEGGPGSLLGPSPLTRKEEENPITSSPEPIAVETATAAEPEVVVSPPQPAPAPAAEADTQTSPVGYTPPPVLDSSVGNPGAFTDEPEEELPQGEIIRDPYAPSAVENAPPAEEGADHISKDAEASSSQEVEGYKIDPSPSYFSKPITDSAESLELAPQVTTGFIDAIRNEGNISTGADTASVTTVNRSIAPAADEMADQHAAATLIQRTWRARSNTASADKSITPPTDDDADQHAAATLIQRAWRERSNTKKGTVIVPVVSGQTAEHDETLVTPPVTPPASRFSLPAYSYDMNAGQEAWGGSPQKSRDIGANGNAGGPSIVRAPEPYSDPFADPIVPRVAISQPEFAPVPPMFNPHPELSEQHVQPPVPSAEEAHGSFSIMPMPVIQDAAPSRSIKYSPSNHNLMSAIPNNDTDETRPLLEMPKVSYLTQPTSVNVVGVSPSTAALRYSNRTAGSTALLHEFGWLEYHLPDGTFYYVHPTRRVTTDANLRNDSTLNAVSSYLEPRSETPVGAELWVRDMGNTKRGVVLTWGWVDHQARTVTMEKHSDRKGKKVRESEEDQMDMEFRYWSYLEAHPSHIALPATLKTEALDALSWAWADCLMPSNRAIPTPFKQEECQELTNLLRSSDDASDQGIQTRLVARILLRIVTWRQAHFRPHKSLPKDVSVHGRHHGAAHRRPFRRALFDFLVSCLCLGIPYLFVERINHHHRLDEESGIRSVAPVLVIGACTCLVAAIVLSASVTFLSLPGLDSVARIACLVAILFAAFSMASTLAAIFRYKADMERTASHIGGEGLMLLSRRGFILSLPLVFLAYSVIGFVTAIVLYSFRGTTASDPLGGSFDDHTKWTVVGVLGALAGMLTVSFLLLKR